jgi:nitrogen fixation NifU-like protein
MTMYSEKVLEYFSRPQNVGTIEKADGFGKASGGARCPDDIAHVWIRVADDRIVEVKHKTLGCPVAIAASSMTTVMAQGKTLVEALQITEEMVVQALGGVPERKADSIVAVGALRQAIADYQGKQ